jgi:apolipoprotein D and lipocalin family protein
VYTNVNTNPDGSLSEICGYAATTDVGGVLKVYFPVSPVAGDYEVLETDYESYAAVWSCVNVLGLFHQEVGYVLTRDQVPSEDLKEKVRQVYRDQGLTDVLGGFKSFDSGPDCNYDVPDSCAGAD